LQPKGDGQTDQNDADDTDAPTEKKAKLDEGEVWKIKMRFFVLCFVLNYVVLRKCMSNFSVR